MVNYLQTCAVSFLRDSKLNLSAAETETAEIERNKNSQHLQFRVPAKHDFVK